eukprot:CAMPEP_0177622332 /NCGR_PEP_ID=MMETSP0419_2-20121207/28177_1 /TAXON_ID=582737 /ORGANISM="Tetraselmis sp., Strain GSL018" /LENGTH=574 /DNA_ID=CAMNT_0019122539 /DNA_START=92 /DNA_END=1819 /DNA_ORIENTATION=+
MPSLRLSQNWLPSSGSALESSVRAPLAFPLGKAVGVAARRRPRWELGPARAASGPPGDRSTGGPRPEEEQRTAASAREEAWRESVRQRVAKRVEEGNGSLSGSGISPEAMDAARAGGVSDIEATELGAAESAPSPLNGGGNSRVVSVDLGANSTLVGLGMLTTTALVTYATDALGLDASRGSDGFAATCLLWTLPAALATAELWRRALRGDAGVLGRFLRDRARSAVKWEHGAGSVLDVGVGASLNAAAEGLLFRGTGLTLAASFLAGFDTGLYGGQPLCAVPLEPIEIISSHHVPMACVWPFVALCAAALEHFPRLLQMGHKGRDAYMDILCAALMTQTKEVQLAVYSAAGELTLKKGRRTVAPSSLPPSSIHRAAAFSLSSIRGEQRWREGAARNLALQMLEAAFLSAETILTGSLWASIATGAVCKTIAVVFPRVHFMAEASSDGIEAMTKMPRFQLELEGAAETRVLAEHPELTFTFSPNSSLSFAQAATGRSISICLSPDRQGRGLINRSKATHCVSSSHHAAANVAFFLVCLGEGGGLAGWDPEIADQTPQMQSLELPSAFILESQAS